MLIGKTAPSSTAAASLGSSALEQAKAALSAKAGAAAAGAPAPADVNDSTSISPLGKALQGMAASAPTMS
ncbi:MAG TPA: hypothetical protein VED40_08675 [Azospirillaceae bacterium]|nr:hypothetical protein [Azospirillaceae bacterium]